MHVINIRHYKFYSFFLDNNLIPSAQEEWRNKWSAVWFGFAHGFQLLIIHIVILVGSCVSEIGITVRTKVGGAANAKACAVLASSEAGPHLPAVLAHNRRSHMQGRTPSLSA